MQKGDLADSFMLIIKGRISVTVRFFLSMCKYSDFDRTFVRCYKVLLLCRFLRR